MKQKLQGDYIMAAARLINWYNRHSIREVHVNKLIRDSEKFGKLFQVSPRDILNYVIDKKFVLPQGSDSWEINRDA